VPGVVDAELLHPPGPGIRDTAVVFVLDHLPKLTVCRGVPRGRQYALLPGDGVCQPPLDDPLVGEGGEGRGWGMLVGLGRVVVGRGRTGEESEEGELHFEDWG